MNILVVTYWSLDDALIQAYTLPYLRIIKRIVGPKRKVFLFTVEKNLDKLSDEEIEKKKSKLEEEGIEWLYAKYYPFGLKAIFTNLFALIKLLKYIRKKQISTIHTWCTPAGGIGWLLSKLTSTKLILDSFEPHAEPMVEAKVWNKNSLAFRMLWWLEKQQVKSADTVIACVDEMKEYSLRKYGVRIKDFYSKPACVDMKLFQPGKCKDNDLIRKYNLENKLVVVYAGKFGGSYLSQEIFDFFKICEDKWADKFRVVLLNNHSREELEVLSQNSGFDFKKVVHAFVPHKEVPYYMGLGDFGLVPFVPVPSKRYGSPIKTGEYLSLGIPIIITPNISNDSAIAIDSDAGVIMEELNEDGYIKIVEEMERTLTQERVLLKKRIREIAVQYKSFEIAEKVYREVYR